MIFQSEGRDNAPVQVNQKIDGMVQETVSKGEAVFFEWSPMQIFELARKDPHRGRGNFSLCSALWEVQVDISKTRAYDKLYKSYL